MSPDAPGHPPSFCMGVPLPSALKVTSLPSQRALGSRLPVGSTRAVLTPRPQELPEQAENYLSEPPWLRNVEWPGRSRRPAECTGSENKGEEKGRLWNGLILLGCVPQLY